MGSYRLAWTRWRVCPYLVGFASVPMALDYSCRCLCWGILKFSNTMFHMNHDDSKTRWLQHWRTRFEFCCNEICSSTWQHCWQQVGGDSTAGSWCIFPSSGHETIAPNGPPSPSAEKLRWEFFCIYQTCLHDMRKVVKMRLCSEMSWVVMLAWTWWGVFSYFVDLLMSRWLRIIHGDGRVEAFWNFTLAGELCSNSVAIKFVAHLRPWLMAGRRWFDHWFPVYLSIIRSRNDTCKWSSTTVCRQAQMRVFSRHDKVLKMRLCFEMSWVVMPAWTWWGVCSYFVGFANAPMGLDYS